MSKISGIPENIKENLIIKKIKKEEFLSYGENGKIGYLIDGEVQGTRYHDEKKLVFPTFLKKGDFLGLTPILLNTNSDFELETKRDSVVLEIPLEVFKKYILSDPKAEIKLLKDISADLLHTTRAFFIRTHGGTRAYFAYLLYFFTGEKKTLPFLKYSEIEEMIFSSRVMAHRIIREFEQRNILEKKFKELIVKDREELKIYFEKYI